MHSPKNLNKMNELRNNGRRDRAHGERDRSKRDYQKKLRLKSIEGN